MKFSCGCEVDKLDPYNLPDCPETWKLISSGKTKGLFQIESYLGRQWSKKLQPDSIELLSALIALVRPGVLKAKDQDGRSMADIFTERRHGGQIVPLDKNIEDVLDNTYQVIVYQESIIAIAKRLAGFNLVQADILRKGIGHKDAEIVRKCREEFIQGCSKVGLIDEDKANYIFDVIEKSNRYVFNKSHAIAYGITTYITAYLKFHFPLEFYISWLRHSKDDLDFQLEVKELVNDARAEGIKILPPDLFDKEKEVYQKDGRVHFGLTFVKGVGNSIDKFLAKLDGTTWYDILRLDPPPKLMENLIKAGCLGPNRLKKIHELNTYNMLTNMEKKGLKWVDGENSLLETLKNSVGLKKNGGICANPTREAKIRQCIRTLENPPYSLRDTPAVIGQFEEELLGVKLTCTKVDQSRFRDRADCDIQQFHKLDRGMLAAEVGDVKLKTVKTGPNKGREMCILSLGDDSGMLEEVVCFSNEYERFKDVLLKGNIILAELYRRDSIIMRSACQI